MKEDFMALESHLKFKSDLICINVCRIFKEIPFKETINSVQTQRTLFVLSNRSGNNYTADFGIIK
jgi:hypothetical protein